MLVFIARRLGAGIVLVFVVTAVTFLLVYSGGTNIARNVLGAESSAAQVQQKAHDLGLDQPLYEQYWHWLSHAVTGDFGTSYFTGQSVASAVATRVPVSISLLILCLILTTVLSVLLGVASSRLGGFWDRAIQTVSVLGNALPNYLIAVALVVFIALPSNGIFPATGYVPFGQSPGKWLASITLPAIALMIGAAAGVAQQIRSSLLDVLAQDYIRTLRSRGISERAIVYRHALRNAASPALTILGLHIVTLLGGSVIIETVFALPGIGSLAIQASVGGDVPLLMGVVSFMVIVVIIANLLVDVTVGWVNPKARTL